MWEQFAGFFFMGAAFGFTLGVEVAIRIAKARYAMSDAKKAGRDARKV